MGDAHVLLRAPVSEMTYTVSSGTLSPSIYHTIPYHTIPYPHGRPSASRAADQTHRNRSFSRPTRSHGHCCTCLMR